MSPAHPLEGISTDDLLTHLDNAEAALRHDATGYVGAYQLLCPIGHGALGDVYKARSIHPRRADEFVAVKVLNAAASANAVASKHCHEEAYLLSLLDHPNIIRTLESGVHNDQFYLVMDYVSGPDLHTLLAAMQRRGLRMPLAMALYIFDALSDALAYIATATDPNGEPLRLVHRDLCPPNIFVSDSGKVLLGDFNIAVHGARGRAAERLNGGHSGYMAPEQIRGDGVDQRADLFALMAVFFEMVAGVPAFARATLDESCAATLKGSLPKQVPGLEPGLLDQLRTLAKRGFASAPRKRFASIQEMREAVHALFGTAVPTRAAIAGLIAALFRRDANAGFSQVTVAPAVGAGLPEVSLISTSPVLGPFHRDLLASAGFAARMIPDIVTTGQPPVTAPAPTRGPLCLDLASLNDEALVRAQALPHSTLIVMCYELSSLSLARACSLDADAVFFQPYKLGLIAEQLRRDDAARESPSPPSAPREEKLAGRRALMICGHDDGHDEAAPALASALEAHGMIVETCADARQALATAPRRSYHLVIACAASVPDVSALVLQFRGAPGYAALPFVLVAPDVNATAKACRGLENTHVLSAGIGASALCHQLSEHLDGQVWRCFKRFPVDMVAEYAYRGVVSSCRVRDVSRLGMLIEARQMLPIGAQAVFHIVAPPLHESIQVGARVMHLRLGDSEGAPTSLIGLDITDLSSEDEAAWLRLIMALAAPPT